MHGVSKSAGDRDINDLKSCCPFCRTPTQNTFKEIIKRLEKRVELGDMAGTFALACKYKDGLYGVKENKRKWVELMFKAVELGEQGERTITLGKFTWLGIL